MILGAGSSTQHVFKASAVKATSMYGYHAREETFLKIYFYNPGVVKKAADLLHNGAVMDQIIEPYESHVPFTLQFMMDYNLQGMNLIHLSHAVFRLGGDREEETPTGDSEPLSREDLLSIRPSKRVFAVRELSSELLLNPSYPKSSRSSLEIDAVATDILNKNAEANPGLSAMWEDETLRRRDKGLNEGDIPNPSSPPRGEQMMTHSEKFWSDKFNEVLSVAEDADEDKSSLLDDVRFSNSLETHVPSLSTSAIDCKSSSSSGGGSQISAYLDETIVNEELIVSSLSLGTLDEDDKELIDLLAREEDPQEDETHEMSQIIWNSDPFSQE